MDKKAWPAWASVAAMVMALWLVTDWWRTSSVESVPFSQFERDARDGRYVDVQVLDRTLVGTLREPRDGKSAAVTALVEPALAERLSSYGVPFRRVQESNWITVRKPV